MPGLLDKVLDRQLSRHQRAFQHHLARERKQTLVYNQSKRVDSGIATGVTWLDLDRVEQRYLLAAAADGSLAAYDVWQPSNSLSAATASHAPVFKVKRGAPSSHSYTITAAAWYPVDSGLFITASLDGRVQVWDSNALQRVASWDVGSAVFSAAMSPLAHAHALIAAGNAEAQVTLCDARSGGSTHSLRGHRAAVWAAAWSSTSQWHLATGSCDGQVRVWDIRRSGCIALLDQHDSQPTVGGCALPTPDERPEASAGDTVPPGASAAAHDGRVTAVVPTPDGLSWLTAGTDSRVRVWSVPKFRNTLINFPGTRNHASRGRQLAVTEDSRLLFHPSGSVIQVLRLADGQQLSLLRGAHFESINCCVWNSELQELYSGSNDHSIIVWSPLARQQPAETNDDISHDIDSEDAWSS